VPITPRPTSAQAPPAELNAKLNEIARRYAWKARQGRDPTSRQHLLTRVRLREIERLCRYRWGWTLPDDDSGRDDFVIAAHHIAHLRGDVREHIIAWAGVWCPWMTAVEATAIAAEVMAEPIKWKADNLGWRLRLTDAERTMLKITTIGAVDCGANERVERRKAKRRAANRARRAKHSSGKPQQAGARTSSCPSGGAQTTLGVHGVAAEHSSATFRARDRNIHTSG
jgi:hypothetical protein